MSTEKGQVGRFRKKAVEVEAVQWTGGDDGWKVLMAWLESLGLEGEDGDGSDGSYGMWMLVNDQLALDTEQGEAHVGAGDWIIHVGNGELYPCAAKEFEATYEAVTRPSGLPRHICNTPSARASGDDPETASREHDDALAPQQQPSVSRGEAERLEEIAKRIQGDDSAFLKGQADADATFLRSLAKGREGEEAGEESRESIGGRKHVGSPASFEAWTIGPKLRDRLFTLADEIEGRKRNAPAHAAGLATSAQDLRNILGASFDSTQPAVPSAEQPPVGREEAAAGREAVGRAWEESGRSALDELFEAVDPRDGSMPDRFAAPASGEDWRGEIVAWADALAAHAERMVGRCEEAGPNGDNKAFHLAWSEALRIYHLVIAKVESLSPATTKKPEAPEPEWFCTDCNHSVNAGTHCDGCGEPQEWKPNQGPEQPKGEGR